MKNRPAQPRVPVEKPETIRQEIMLLLQDGMYTAREISARTRVSEKEVIDHLEHIRTSLHDKGKRIRLVPATCKGCGFEFHKRERLTRPGRCPVCKGEQIREPRYTME